DRYSAHFRPQAGSVRTMPRVSEHPQMALLTRVMGRALAVTSVLLATACRPPAEPTGAPTVRGVPAGSYTIQAAPKPRFNDIRLREQTVRRHLGFLASDAQEGRSPGSSADHRVQDHIHEAMLEIGLEPGAPNGDFRQPFQVTDGVRLRPKTQTTLKLGSTKIPHSLVAFAHDTGTKPVRAQLVFVGYGIPGKAKNTGDYTGIGPSVAGKIVVALDGGPQGDPHLDPASTRPQTKLIAARDHGAVGFILWEPTSARPYPNRGTAKDLKIPALHVGQAGSEALRAALGTKPGKGNPNGQPLQGITPGATTRAKARMATPVEPHRLLTANVAGRLPGAGSGKTVVIGAHMDHLGHGNASSLAPDENAIHNGADDNASGVAVLLALAEALAEVPQQERFHDLLFVTFGAEEMGLLGRQSSRRCSKSFDGGAKPKFASG
ncbi:MAG: M28 family peptidase, partial [Nannocystaceae bacterium]